MPNILTRLFSWLSGENSFEKDLFAVLRDPNNQKYRVQSRRYQGVTILVDFARNGRLSTTVKHEGTHIKILAHSEPVPRITKTSVRRKWQYSYIRRNFASPYGFEGVEHLVNTLVDVLLPETRLVFHFNNNQETINHICDHFPNSWRSWGLHIGKQHASADELRYVRERFTSLVALNLPEGIPQEFAFLLQEFRRLESA